MILWTSPTNSREQRDGIRSNLSGCRAFDFPICSTRKNVASFSFSGATSIAFDCFAIRIFPLLHSVCAIPPRSDTLNKIFFFFSFLSFSSPFPGRVSRGFIAIYEEKETSLSCLLKLSRHLVRGIVIKSKQRSACFKILPRV